MDGSVIYVNYHQASQQRFMKIMHCPFTKGSKAYQEKLLNSDYLQFDTDLKEWKYDFTQKVQLFDTYVKRIA